MSISREEANMELAELEASWYQDQREEHEQFVYSTATEWDNEEAFSLGEARPEQAWILTDRDVWHANPFYRGPAVAHPDFDDYEDGPELTEAELAAWEAERQAAYGAEEWEAGSLPEADIPF